MSSFVQQFSFREVTEMIRRTLARGIPVAVLTAAAAVAQTGSGTLAQVVVGGPAALSGTLGGVFPRQMNGVTGQPFSAQEETETVQTLADGTHITNGTQKVKHYRDSLGRTRTERTPMQPPGFLGNGAPAPPTFIEIFDPVGGYRYSFNTNNHTAHRSSFGPVPQQVGKQVALPANRVPGVEPTLLGGRAVSGLASAVFASAPGASAPGFNGQRPRPDISTESLGTRTIEGVLAEGTRTTTTYAVGFMGNDRPFSTVNEIWTTRELGIVILTKNSDPRTGETTMKYTNISRAEPDASLFQPPAGYEIEDPQSQPAVK